MGLAETAELAVRISLKDNASSGIRGLQSKLGSLGQSVGRVGKGFGQIGAGIARAGLVVGGAAVTGLAAVAKAAIDFEDAFAGVRKTVNQADLDKAGLTFEGLAQSFRNMATEIPIAAVDLAKIGETAGALGIKAQDITEFTKTVALLSQTTDLSSEAAAESLGKVGTILGLTGKEYTAFADTLVNLGNQGASVESEIIEVTKRFAAMGRQAGLTNDQILALSSAATSLGAEPDAAGSALSRIFSNMSTEIANGTAKGKEFAAITGDSLTELRKRLNKGDALGILMETLKGLSGLSRTESASVLKALGITNVRDRNAILLMAQNLGFVNEQLEIAANSEGALWKEAEKRFSTTASKITLVKTNLIETGIAMGTEMLPAIRRALDKVITFLKDPATKAQAVQLGKDIGKFIDGIDWNKVAEGAKAIGSAMKGAAEFAMTLVSMLDKLPGELKAAGLGFLALNKLSGGLLGQGVGNVVGGLAGAAATGLASRAPGIGRLFAQPVFVTNWPLGGIGGGAAGAAGGGWTKTGLGMTALAAVVIPEVLSAVQEHVVMPKLQEQAGANITSTQAVIDTKDPAKIAAALAQIQTNVGSLSGLQKVLYDLNANGVKTHTEGLEAALAAALQAALKGTEANLQQLPENITEKQQAKFDALRDKMEASRIATVNSSRSIVSGANSDRNAIVTAIRENRPILTVNLRVGTGTKSYVYQSATKLTRLTQLAST